MLSLAVGTVGCAAEFELSSLNVSPEVCLPNDTVTVSATIANNGNAKGDYVAELLVNGVTEHLQNYTLEPGASESLSFTLSRGDLGKYEVQIGELAKSFIVIGANNLTISPSQALIDEPVTIAVDLQNVAETQATYHCCLMCDGKELEAQDMTVAGTSTEKVMFTLSQANSGRYQVELLGLSGSYKVLKPADIKLVNLDVTPDTVKVGQEATITMSITNMGEAEGYYEARLLVEDIAFPWIYEAYPHSIKLAGGAKKTLSTSVIQNKPGNYRIRIAELETTLSVIEPVRLETGTCLLDEMGSGIGELRIENETMLDTVIVLCPTSQQDTPVFAIYVQSEDSHKFKGIEEGIYIMYIALGEAWDENSQRFYLNDTYYRAQREIEWEEKKTARRKEWITWTWNLNLEYGPPGLPISEYEFPSLG
jgi:hypothetical protein